MEAKVFVSSTFQDLEQHREAVQKSLRRLGMIDVSMEHFGARDALPVDECIRLVKESDYFVGIYAHSFGFVPDGSEKSVTQLEFEAAVEAQIPKLLYLINEDHPWPPKFIAEGEDKERLSAFKKELSLFRIRAKFTTPDDLSKGVAADLGREQSINNSSNRVGIDIPVNPIPLDSSKLAAVKPAENWSDHRSSIYRDNRRVFLTHVIKPSQKAGQDFDVSIYLLRHKSSDLSDISHAEFFLGEFWGNKVFPAVEETPGFIGISTSAYGTFLCTCTVYFEDGYKIDIHRYIDFEADRMKHRSK